MPSIKSSQAAIDAAGITHNAHTLLTFRDCEVQWQQYLAFLQRKKKQLEEEIQHKKMRGVTKEQYDEIEKQFKQFDSNKNGVLDRNEFKACLFSLGYEYDSQAITKIMRQHGAAEKDDKKLSITHTQFTEFMIGTLGDTDTKEEIVLGFKLINKNQDHATVDLLSQVMPEADVKYVTDNAPRKAAGFDYVALTNALFSR